MAAHNSQPWLHRASTDVIFILMPLFMPLAAIAIFPGYFIEENETNLISWILLVLLVDVSHVYSTLYRTYADKEFFATHKNLLLLVPIFSFIVGALLFNTKPGIFWTCIAYLAVFHFVRQQYGFMRLYSRKENQTKIFKLIDTFAIYAATLYPIAYWHTHERDFQWFVKGDFLSFNNEYVHVISLTLYCIIQLSFLVKCIFTYVNNREFNLPKFLLWLGTSLTWYIGIVALNGDLTFTMTNVIAHGIPYIALIWFFTKKKQDDGKVTFSLPLIATIFKRNKYLLFLLPLFAFAFFEETLWDSLVWREEHHSALFGYFDALPRATSKELLALVIPLLSVPQLTHYILDGYIWKIRKEE